MANITLTESQLSRLANIAADGAQHIVIIPGSTSASPEPVFLVVKSAKTTAADGKQPVTVTIR